MLLNEMASKEQLSLSTFIKDVHNLLRKSTKEKGDTEAWEEHCNNEVLLNNYAKSMKKLANLWEINANTVSNSTSTKFNKKSPNSRITWTIDFTKSYFFSEKNYKDRRSREKKLMETYGYETENSKDLLEENIENINFLDIGSCYNPFKIVESFDVTAIDLYPENETVLKGDFLKVSINSNGFLEHLNNEVQSLPVNFYHCIVFSLLLEYLPTSEQRILCCRKAYDLLKFEGILIIITPDSQHVGKNARLMKNWRYTLATLGFSRIKFEKFSHITCMVFRKSISKEICERWASIHKEPVMQIHMDIPQDS